MNQILSRILPSDGNNTQILEHAWTDIEVIAGNRISFQAPMRRKFAPAKFKVSYNVDKGKNGSSTAIHDNAVTLSPRRSKLPVEHHDLIVFGSFTEPQPKEDNSDFIWNAPNKILVTPEEPKAPVFDDNAQLNLVFFSQTGCSISVYLSFAYDPTVKR
jgi:hypothetical protein